MWDFPSSHRATRHHPKATSITHTLGTDPGMAPCVGDTGTPTWHVPGLRVSTVPISCSYCHPNTGFTALERGKGQYRRVSHLTFLVQPGMQ